MIKFTLAENSTLLIPSRPLDKSRLISTFGNYGEVYHVDACGYQYRGFPLSDLPVILGEFGKVVIEE
jgi:hypothetical protein